MKKRSDALLGYLFLGPAVIGLFGFVVVPMLWAFLMGFSEWDLINPPKFVGFSNYISLFQDELFLSSLKQTLLFSLEVIPLLFICSLFLAILLNQKFVKGRSVFRLIYFSPVVVSLVIVSIVWRFIFDSSFGIANYLLLLVHIPPQRWLASAQQALPSIGLVTVWKSIGYYMVIFLAGLQTIPNEYYEAAIIDGASASRKFIHITLPLLKGTSIFVVVMCTIDSLRTFTQIYVMTQGGPAKSTYVLALNIYRSAFVFQKMGYASAMAVILFLIILTFSVLERRYLRENE